MTKWVKNQANKRQAQIPEEKKKEKQKQLVFKKRVASTNIISMKENYMNAVGKSVCIFQAFDMEKFFANISMSKYLIVGTDKSRTECLKEEESNPKLVVCPFLPFVYTT